MASNEKKHPLLQRKFLLAVATVITILLSEYARVDIAPETLVKIMIPVCTWIVVEGYVDSKAVKK